MSDGLTQLRARVETLEFALRDSVEGMEEMIGYVDEYFRKKWGHQDYIDRAKLALGEADTKPLVDPVEIMAMDAFIADVCQNGGQHSPEMDAWCEKHKGIWSRIRQALHTQGEG